MVIRLVALLIAEVDMAWLVLRRLEQQATIDTSVWIAIIAGVVGLLTLAIQTYGQIQVAGIKDRQEKQAIKLQEVHTVVNSGESKLIEQVGQLTADLNLLKGAAEERQKADDKEQNQRIGAASVQPHVGPPMPVEPKPASDAPDAPAT